MKKIALPVVAFFILLPSALANSAEDDCKLGTEAYSASKYQEALQYLDKAIKAKPDYAEAFEYRSNAHQGLNQIQPAISDLTQAIKFAPNKGYLHAARAQLYLKESKGPAALGDLDWCVLNLKDPNVHIQNLLARAQLYEQLGKTDRAMSDVLAARQAFDHDKKIVNGRLFALQLQALLSLDAGNFRKALIEAEEVIAKMPKDSYADEIYAIRGRAHAGTGDYARALMDLNQSITIISSGSAGDPFEQKKRDLRKARDYTEAAYCNEHLNDLDAAIDCVSKAIVLDPLNPSLHLNRQKLFLAIGELALANEDKEKVLELSKEAKKHDEN